MHLTQNLKWMGGPPKMAKDNWSHPSRTRIPSFRAGLRSSASLFMDAAASSPRLRLAYHHTHHCHKYLRQTLMCDPAHTLEMGDFPSIDYEKDRTGDTLVCRDWRQFLYLKSATRSGYSGGTELTTNTLLRTLQFVFAEQVTSFLYVQS
ncbi:hypothetical protein BDR07DRAFT_519805 [Suillus spraguei]|nr:hypothetical protein BDR07DRAFT_519805 [Suillus spraguei]